VTFRWKDCRAKGKTRYKAMTLAAEEFMRRFLLPMLRQRGLARGAASQCVSAPQTSST
jgi:hypothetical protein